jgi:hypothetical protein
MPAKSKQGVDAKCSGLSHLNIREYHFKSMGLIELAKILIRSSLLTGCRLRYPGQAEFFRSAITGELHGSLRRDRAVCAYSLECVPSHSTLFWLCLHPQK